MVLSAHRYYDVSPRIVRAGSTVVITIRPLHDHVRLDSNNHYHLTWQPLDGPPSRSVTLHVEPRSGALHFKAEFLTEGEYVILLNSNQDERSRNFVEFHIYALDDDLYNRRPYKGDLHMHSNHSDGRESPAYVAAACRRIGLDFMAVTDHAQYAPSLKAIQAYQNLPLDLRIFPGEEVHSPDHPVHIVNFGGQFSINDLFDEPLYKAEVQQIANQLPPIQKDISRKTYASCLWTFDKIRQANGLGIFCHPYWVSLHRYDIPAALTEVLLSHQPFDALELIGGYYPHESDSNLLQVARYHEARTKGKRIPIVGVSDAHGCERDILFGWYYTVVFSPSLDLADLILAIKDCYSVAVEHLPDQPVRSHGPFRLVRYAQFLLHHIFPEHDEICVEEGQQMLAYLAGEPQAAEKLAALQGRTCSFFDHIFDGSSRSSRL
jgi:hypothetical protein